MFEQNKIKKQYLILTPFFLFLFNLFTLSPAYSGELKLISSDSNSLVYEFKAGGIKSHNKEINGELFQGISLENSGSTNIPGAPILPVKSKLIEIPSGKKLSYKIIEARSNIYKGFYLSPYPEIYSQEILIPQQSKENNKTIPLYPPLIRGGQGGFSQEINGNFIISKRFAINGNIYSKNEFYPENIVEISKEGFIRNQKVALLKIFPVQFNPVSREIRVYPKIKIQISFEPDIQKVNFKSNSSQKTSIFSATQFPSLKIAIKEDGIYRITSSDLEQAGIDTSTIDPKNIRMFNKENELAILSMGENDGVFDDGDYIEFYGEKNNGEFTDTNIYWLVIDDTPGKRMNNSGTSPSLSKPFESSFKAIYHGEENIEYTQTIPKKEGKEHWFWHTFITEENTSKSFTINFTLNNLKKKNGNTSLKVSFQGLTDVPVNPDHHTQIFLNDKLVYEKKWDGFSEYSPNKTIPHSLLKNEENTLEIKAFADKGITIDGINLNWFEIGYYKLLAAENDSLIFSKTGNKNSQFKVTNFSTKNIEVFDVTDPYEVKVIKAKTKKIAGKFAALFKDKIEGEKNYYAIEKNKVKKSDTIEIDEESALKSSGNGADYIIITHKDFYDAINPLKVFREGKGLNVKVVKIDDVYDEFSSGIFTPDAIRDFLKFTYENWNPKPQYVLLVGDANYDYKDYIKSGVKNYIPVKLVNTSFFGPTPSDNWFVSVNGDDKFPDIYIGRIPAKTKEEVEAVVNKIINYENSQPFSDWNNNVLLISDNYIEDGVPDDGGNFPNLSDNLAALLSNPFISQKTYLSDYPKDTSDAQLQNIVSATRTEIINGINDGALLTNYTGHGDKVDWAREKIFTSDDIPSLSNNNKLTFVTTLNCLNGFFPDYLGESLGEEFLLAKDKGAIGFWGATGVGFNADYEKIGTELFKTIFQNKEKTLGKAVTDSLISAVTNTYLPDEYLEDLALFGDPALQLGLP